MPVLASDVAAGGATLSEAIIKTYEGDALFEMLGQQFLDQLKKRDDEDDVKLQKGIQVAIDKEVLPAKPKVEKTIDVYNDGKTPDEVTQEIIDKLGDAPSKGCVMTLQGLSGTGKGTTVAKLHEKLPNATTWSNGDIFRSLTLLAMVYAKQNNTSLENALTPALLKQFLSYLTFDKFGDKFDTKIEGLGLSLMVSEVNKTTLKESKEYGNVSINVPTVAAKTQGEVILFIQGAMETMTKGGMNVLMEGRTATLNYIRTPHRFELKVKNEIVLGKRQAALVIGNKVKGVTDAAAIKAALDNLILETLVVDLKVSAKKSIGFYIRAATSFFKGLEAKVAEGDKPALAAKAPVKKINISGLGAAINIAVAVASRVEADGIAAVVKVKTEYLELSKGSSPQIIISMERK